MCKYWTYQQVAGWFISRAFPISISIFYLLITLILYLLEHRVNQFASLKTYAWRCIIKHIYNNIQQKPASSALALWGGDERAWIAAWLSSTSCGWSTYLLCSKTEAVFFATNESFPLLYNLLEDGNLKRCYEFFFETLLRVCRGTSTTLKYCTIMKIWFQVTTALYEDNIEFIFLAEKTYEASP